MVSLSYYSYGGLRCSWTAADEHNGLQPARASSGASSHGVSRVHEKLELLVQSYCTFQALLIALRLAHTAALTSAGGRSSSSSSSDPPDCELEAGGGPAAGGWWSHGLCILVKRGRVERSRCGGSSRERKSRPGPLALQPFTACSFLLHHSEFFTLIITI